MRRTHLILIIVVSAIMILVAIITTFSQATILQQSAAIFLGLLTGMAAVAEILGLLDRLGIPETIGLSQTKFVLRDKSPCDTTMAIWGPAGSGKSWLINAFAQTISAKYKKGYSGFMFTLLGQDNLPIIGSPHVNIPPTVWINLSQFRFSRNRTGNRFSELISSFSHNIYIYDNPGGAATRICFENEDKDELREIIANLAYADIVIVVLDPTIVKEKNMIFFVRLFIHMGLQRQNTLKW